MNGFRITILVLFCLVVGLMFYAVAVVLPARQEQYDLYQSSLKIKDYEQRNAEHQARMERLNPSTEAPEVETARNAALESEQQREQALTEAEESSVIAAAKRKQEERAAAEEAERNRAAANADSNHMGRVAAFDAEWNVILFVPETKTPLNNGLEVAVRRGEQIVCEAVVDGKDEESGQVSATVKPANFGDSTQNIELPKPQAGDEVILNPFLTGRDLRLQQDNSNFGDPKAMDPAAPKPQPLPEVEASLIPVS